MFMSFVSAEADNIDWEASFAMQQDIDALCSAGQTKLFGFSMVNAARIDVAQSIVTRSVLRKRTTTQFLNAHCINIASTDAAYREALACADFLLPDGSGLAIAARLAGQKLGENLNGTDLFPEICREATAAGQSIFLLGGKPGIAAKAAEAMRETFPHLTVAGTHHGNWQDEDEDAIVHLVNASGASILFVGLGVPVQEKWIARLRGRLAAHIVLGVGGLFDYYSGAIPRAPSAIRAVGCEWIWRLAQEPRRMAGRYLLGNLKFLVSALRHGWQARGFSERLSLKSKRAFDFSAGCAALALASPIFLLVAVMIKLEDRGPVFFLQTRIGAHGAPFRMWKFRSMVVDAEARLAAIREESERDGVCFKMKRDPRVTWVGSWLRRLSLDELPQLINIVQGSMSIVGPRPALPREVLTYDHISRERLLGAPGLTCTWQVSGRADIAFDRQVALDVDYLRSRSMMKDFVLIARTIPAVLTARGAY